jgi:signal transduction histidine kinase
MSKKLCLRQQRLEQFTQDASHELRTPLASLNSSLDLALRTKNYEKGILSAKEDLQEVSSLVERLLELARLDRLVLSPSLVDASELMASIVDRHREAAMKRSVTIALHAAPDVRVHADAALLRQLVSNLLTNAIKFSKSEGGTVDVTLSGERLVISDNGIGIASEHLAHIFDRFYQADTSRSEDGYGLGLALVKRIADLHQWTVHADSTYGKGSVFTVNFVAQHKRRAS